jgi:hypothetical protein
MRLADTTIRLADTTTIRLADTKMRLADTTIRLEDTTMRLEDTTTMRLADTTTMRLADTTKPNYLDCDMIHEALAHPSLTQINTNNFISILYFNINVYIYIFKPCIYNLILYICKLVLMLFVIYPSKKPP